MDLGFKKDVKETVNDLDPRLPVFRNYLFLIGMLLLVCFFVGFVGGFFVGLGPRVISEYIDWILVLMILSYTILFHFLTMYKIGEYEKRMRPKQKWRPVKDA